MARERGTGRVFQRGKIWWIKYHWNGKIAEKLELSSKTVDTYRSRLMGKLGVRDLPELVRFAIKHGITPID